MLQTSTNGQESPANCTETAHANRRIPDWLRPYKDQWVSGGKLKELIAAEGAYFGPWLDSVRPRLRSVSLPSRNGTGPVTKYLVRHVWAAALAHGLRLIPTEASKPEAALRAENARLREALAAERGKVRLEYVNVDRTADSLEIVRLMVTATEPQPRPGVYFLLADDDSVIYVGQSKNVLSRMVGHGGKTYATVRMIHVADEKRRLEVEARLIEWLQPPLNLNGLGTRRPEIERRAM